VPQFEFSSSNDLSDNRHESAGKGPEGAYPGTVSSDHHGNIGAGLVVPAHLGFRLILVLIGPIYAITAANPFGQFSM